VRRCNVVARTREGEAATGRRAPHQGRREHGCGACLGCPLPGQGWGDTTPLHAPLGVTVLRAHADL